MITFNYLNNTMCLIVMKYVMGVRCERSSKQNSISNELYTSNSNVFWNHTWKSAQWRA